MSATLLLFSSFLILSTTISLTASNWLIAWAGMELNLLSFIPLIMFTSALPKPQKAPTACTYFLAQATGSILFLTSPALSLNPSLSSSASLFLLLGLMTKAGMIPMHQWFPNISSSLSWPAVFTLFTWQKLTPLFLLFHLNFPPSVTSLVFILAGTNALVGALLGLAQTLSRPLLAYSSISNMGWMLALSELSPTAANHFLFTYLIMLFPLLTLFANVHVLSLRTLHSLSKMPLISRSTAAILLLNLAGLPPFTGFFLKVMGLSLLLPAHPMVSLFFILASSLSLGFYLHLALLSSISIFQTFIPSHMSLPNAYIPGLLVTLSFPLVFSLFL